MKYFCKICNKVFKTKESYAGHFGWHNKNRKIIKLTCPKCQKQISVCNFEKHFNICKGQFEPQKHVCRYCKTEMPTSAKLGGHVSKCKQNPNYKPTFAAKGWHHTKAVKRRISKNMKLAHKEGRAYSWHNGYSYPEIFFKKVIENEFLDKNCIRQFRIKHFRIDFFWPHKKRAIEIDGQQHDATVDNDLKRDEFLKQNHEIEMLRIRWKSLFHEPQKYIAIAKKFIDD